MPLFSISKNKPDLTNFNIIGVTGTSGKTAVADMINHIFTENGLKAGYISSLGYTTDGTNFKDDIDILDLKQTDLNNMINEMQANGLNFLILEAHPENIEAGKFKNLELDSAVITNTFEDPNFEVNNWDSYVQNKLKFIKLLKDKSLLVLNSDDQRFLSWLNLYNNEIKSQIYTYLSSKMHAQDVKNYLDGVTFQLGNQPIRIKNPGPFNLANTIQAYKVAERYVNPHTIADKLSTYQAPQGRMEVIQTSPYVIIIDYAYTPEMLEASLSHIYAMKPTHSQIITVLGSVGEKYKSRRRMGEVACKYSSLLILAAQDPGYEKVADINSEIAKYAESKSGMIIERLESTEEYKMIDKDRLKKRIDRAKDYGDIPIISFDSNHYSSRYDAIDFALKSAKNQDIIYITGKGHETGLYFGDIEYEWSDSEAVKQILNTKTNVSS